MKKKPASNASRHYRDLALTYKALSIIVTLGPMMFYVIMGFIHGETTQKFAMGSCAVVAIILVAVNIIMKINLRSPLWILLIGVYICLRKIEVLLIVMAVTTMLDEFWFSPAYKSFKGKYTINREIDKRENL